MKKRPFVYLILALILAFGSCNDPIFYMIANEMPIAKPLIGGSPTNFVEYGGNLYVASGSKIYSYNGNRWDAISSPGGRVVQLAATTNNLYALYLKGSGSETRHVAYSNGGNWNWTDININDAVTIFAANTNNVLFICAGNGDVNGNTIYYSQNNGSPSPISGTSDTSILSGVAYNGTDYFLCTKNDGIFHAPGTPGTAAPVSGSSSVEFTGIIRLGTTTSVVAISRDGNLYSVSTATIGDSIASFSDNRLSNGGLAIWTDPATPTNKLLLAGRQDISYSTVSGYTYGYMELKLNSSGGIETGENFVEPGKGSFSTVSDFDRYVSTIGKNPVNHIFQTPSSIDTKMTLFASTQKNGVWSYRDSESHWNTVVE